MKPKLSALELWGLLAPMSMMVMMMIVWFAAYLSPARSVIVMVDIFHEASFELILIPSATFMAMLGQWKIIKSLRKVYI